jgi:hypothetical protein
VLGSDADGDGGTDDDGSVGRVDTGPGDGVGGETVGAQRRVWAVLFGAADR